MTTRHERHTQAIGPKPHEAMVWEVADHIELAARRAGPAVAQQAAKAALEAAREVWQPPNDGRSQPR